MSTMEYKPVITVQDVVDAGACRPGVRRFLRDCGQIAARTDDFPHVDWIQEAANNGYGFGHGYGHGHGYGDDQGHDDGWKYGDGDAYGDEGEAGYRGGDGDGDGCGEFLQRTRAATSAPIDGNTP